MEASRTAAISPRRREWRDDDDLAPRGVDAFFAEFVGTLMLVFFVGMIVSLHHGAGIGVTDWAVIGLVHFLLLAFLVHSLGGASGAHFNPAVTVTLAALRKIGVRDAAIYIVLQLVAAVLAALLVKLLLDNEGDPVNYGAPGISDLLDGKTLAGFLAELIGTFALMWAIMGVAVNPQGARDWAGFTIGGALGFAVMVFGPLTGAGLNPARSFGPALVGGGFDDAGTFIVAYVLGPIVGALLAGVLYSAGILSPEGTEGRRPVDTLSGDDEDRRGGGTTGGTGAGEAPGTGRGIELP